jgi:serine/threonine protein kinase
LKASTGKAFGVFSGSYTMRTQDPYIGRYFGNYQVIAKIDCGAFGCVYQVHHAFLPRVAAIKLLHATRLRSQEARNEFLQEAQLLERLKHPHILQIYEFGLDDSLPYLVTEYASRGSLRDLLNSRASQLLPLRMVISIIAQIGEALHYAHQQGVIHHDLKPENILFNERNDALLADFGVAIVRTTTATLEQVAEVNGTPAYMAPEQFQGRASRRSDQYSLGCILYELVTGRRPFTAPDAISMGFMHMREAPIPPTWLNPNLPLQMDRVILKALEKRRINRYPDIPTFIQELQAIPVTRTHVLTRRRANTPTLVSKTKEQHLNEGIQLYSLGRYREALAAFEQALRLDPHFAAALFAKGNALYFLERYEDALLAFEQAIRLDPHDAALRNNKGCALYALGRYREALTAYNQSLRINPHHANAQQGKKLALRRLGRLR